MVSNGFKSRHSPRLNGGYVVKYMHTTYPPSIGKAKFVTTKTWEQAMAAKAAVRAAARERAARTALPPKQRPRFRPLQEAAKSQANYCVECTTLRIDGPHGWTVFITCGGYTPEKCAHGHEHHRDEVWRA